MIDVICVGSATLDIFVRSPDFQVMPSGHDGGLVLCETYGAKLEVDELLFTSGGGATNAAASFHKKGFTTQIIAEIGQDMPASALVKDLQTRQLPTDWIIQEPSEHTAVSIILSAPQGGRSIVTDRGASRMLDISDIKWDALECKWLYIASIGGRLDVLEALINHARSHSINIACNPGAKELAQPEILHRLIPQMDVLIINDSEARQLLTSPHQPIHDLILALKSLGPTQIIMTAGEQGAYAISADRTLYTPPSNIPVVEATGAGDAFGSGYIAGQILSWDIATSMQLAAANAQSVIQKVGAKDGLITLEEFAQLAKVSVQER